MKERFKKILGDTKEIITKYRFTFLLIVINTLLMLFLYDEYDYNELLTALVLANSLFFVVETFVKKKGAKIILLLASFLVSGVFNHILYETENTPRIPLLIMGIYATIGLVTLYKLSKEEDRFEGYMLKVFNHNLLLMVASFVLEMGVLFIGYITSRLLFPDDTFDIILRLEILLFGLFIVPGEIMTLTYIKGEVLKPIKALVCYVLLPIVLIAELVIYIYFVKIIVMNAIPANEIFGIITALFVVGAPTYILVSNYEKDNKVIETTVKYFPYFFIPLIIMAMYSLGVRIFDYGITMSRYLGVIVIALEIFFVIFGTKKNRKYMRELLLIGAVLTCITLVIPYVNIVGVSRTSQLRRLTALYQENTNYDSLSDEEKDRIYSCYSYLIYDLESEDYIPKYIDTSKIRHNYIDYDDNDMVYLTYYNDDETIPIKDYNYIKTIHISDYGVSFNQLELQELPSEEERNIFKKYISGAIELDEFNDKTIVLGDNSLLYVEELHVSYDKKNLVFETINISGYLLTK